MLAWGRLCRGDSSVRSSGTRIGAPLRRLVLRGGSSSVGDSRRSLPEMSPDSNGGDDSSALTRIDSQREAIGVDRGTWHHPRMARPRTSGSGGEGSERKRAGAEGIREIPADRLVIAREEVGLRQVVDLVRGGRTETDAMGGPAVRAVVVTRGAWRGNLRGRVGRHMEAVCSQASEESSRSENRGRPVTFWGGGRRGQVCVAEGWE